MKIKFIKTAIMIATVFTGAISLSGCSTSRLVDVWKDPQFDFGNINKVVVIAAFDANSRRRIWEDSFVKVLSDYGISAVPSYKFYPKDIPIAEDVHKMFNDKYDGVVLIRKLDTKIVKRYVPGNYYVRPVGWVPSPFFRSYRLIYAGYHTPGYFTKDRVFQFEASLYKANDEGTLIWDAVSQIEDPSSQKELSRELSKLIVPKMMDIDESKSSE